MRTALQCKQDSESYAAIALEGAITEAKMRGMKTTTAKFNISTWPVIQPKFEEAGFKFARMEEYGSNIPSTGSRWDGTQAISWDI